MKLDESIELKNKKILNIKEMKMSNQHMRSIMEEMFLDETIKNCMYEVLTTEGFLPETLSENETYEDVMSNMMEDDEIMLEMYKSCSMSESDCGYKIKEWINEKLTGNQKKLDKNNNGKIDSEDFEILRNKKSGDLNEYDKEVMGNFKKQYGKKSGKEIYYATANKQDRNPKTFKKNEGEMYEGEMYEGNHPEGEHYKNKINQICKDLENINKCINSDDELPAWIQDKIAVMYHSADAINTYLSGAKNSFDYINESDDDFDYLDSDDSDYIINKKAILDRLYMNYNKFINKFIPLIDELNESDIVKHFNPEGQFTLNGFKDFLTQKENESVVDLYTRVNVDGDFTYRRIFAFMVDPSKRDFFEKYRSNIDTFVLNDMEDILDDIFDIKNNIYVKRKDLEKHTENSDDDFSYEDDDPEFKQNVTKTITGDKSAQDFISADDLFGDFDDDDDLLEETTYPIKGKNVDSENKTNSNKENQESIKNVDKSQKTINQKVDNLKNQKYNLTNTENNIKNMMIGLGNNLDLDYQDELSKETKDRILDLASGLAPKEHANVDHESTAGEKLIDASKKRKEYLTKNYTSKPDRTSIEQEDQILTTMAVDENISRLKNLFGYEEKIIKENKKHVVNEDELFFKQISTKKFL